jgi:hypothetical protein
MNETESYVSIHVKVYMSNLTTVQTGPSDFEAISYETLNRHLFVAAWLAAEGVQL